LAQSRPSTMSAVQSRSEVKRTLTHCSRRAEFISTSSIVTNHRTRHRQFAKSNNLRVTLKLHTLPACAWMRHAKWLSLWCPGAESNHRHADFQSAALPTELPGPWQCRGGLDIWVERLGPRTGGFIGDHWDTVQTCKPAKHRTLLSFIRSFWNLRCCLLRSPGLLQSGSHIYRRATGRDQYRSSGPNRTDRTFVARVCRKSGSAFAAATVPDLTWPWVLTVADNSSMNNRPDSLPLAAC
jgi:hypothetical protein